MGVLVVQHAEKNIDIKQKYQKMLFKTISLSMRRLQKFGPSFTYNLTLLSKVKQKVEDEPNFYDLLRISKLYHRSICTQIIVNTP
jgi:hypothetical protein